MSGDVLRSERLVFRRWERSDEPLAFDLWGDPSVTAHIDSRQQLTRAETTQRLDLEMEFDRRSGLQYWPIFYAESGMFVGCCGLHPENALDKTPELGVHLCRSAWGRGLAREAAAAVIRYAFSELHLPLIFAGHHPENHRSGRILLSLGFRRVGENLYPPTGLVHPYYLLRPEEARNVIPSEER